MSRAALQGITNGIPIANISRGYGGESLSQRAGGATPFTGAGASAAAVTPLAPPAPTGEVNNAVADTAHGNVLVALAGVAIIMFLLAWLVKRANPTSTMAHIGLNPYNLLYIGLATVLIKPVLKWFFVKVRIPGATPLVLAS